MQAKNSDLVAEFLFWGLFYFVSIRDKLLLLIGFRGVLLPEAESTESAVKHSARACKEKAEVEEQDARCGLRARKMRALQERVYFVGIKSDTTPGADAAFRGVENCCRRHTFKRLSRGARPAGRRRPAPGRMPTRRRPGGGGFGKDALRGG